MKIYLDVEVRRSGNGGSEATAELEKITKEAEKLGHTVTGATVKIRGMATEAKAAAAETSKAMAAASKPVAADAHIKEWRKLGQLQERAATDDIIRSKARWKRLGALQAAAIAEDITRTRNAEKEKARILARSEADEKRRLKRLEAARAKEANPEAFAGIGKANIIARALPFGDVIVGMGALTGKIQGIGKTVAILELVKAGFAGIKAGVLAAVGALTTYLGVSMKLLISGAEFNSMLQQGRNGIAAMLTTFTELTIGGKKVEDQTVKWNAAMEVSGGMQKLLQAAAIRTAASYEELARAMQEAAGPAFAKGFNPAQVVQFTTSVAQVAQAISLPFDQLNQEVRGLLEGDMSRHSRIARLLLSDLAIEAKKSGKTVAESIQEMAKQGTLFDYLNGKFKDFQKAAQEGANTFSVAFSNFKDAFQQALGQATIDGTLQVTKALQTLTAQIVTFDNAGRAHFNRDLVTLMKMMGDSAAWLAKTLMGAAKYMGELARATKAFVSLDWAGMTQTLYKSWLGWFLPGGLIFKGLDKFRDLSFRLHGMAPPTSSMDAAIEKQKELETAASRAARASYNAAANAMFRGGAKFEYGDEREQATFNRDVGRAAKAGGVDLATVYREVGTFAQNSSNAQKVAFIREMNKAMKDGKLTLDEFAMAQQNALVGGYEFGRQVQGSTGTVKDHTAAVSALINAYQALADKARNAAQTAGGVGRGTEDLIEKFNREAQAGRAEKYINDAEIELAKFERSSLDPEASNEALTARERKIEAMKVEIEVRRKNLALMKEQFAAGDREKEIAGLERQAAELVVERDKLLRELGDLGKRLGTEKGLTGGDRKAIQEQIGIIVASLGQIESQRIASESRVSEATEAATQATADNREKIISQSEENIAKIHADTGEKINNIEKKDLKTREAALAKHLKQVAKGYQDLAKVIGRALGDAMKAMSEGGDMKEGFAQLAEGFAEMARKGIEDAFVGYFSEQMAIAETGKDLQGNVVEPGARRNAQMVTGGIAAAGAAYSIWNQGGATRGQNMMGGAMTGLATGAQIGSYVGMPVVGAIVGMIAGAVLGAFAPTGEKLGFRIISSVGGIRVIGTGDTKPRQAEQALRDINKAIADVRGSMLDMFIDMPLSVLEAIGGHGLNPRLPDIDKTIDATKSSTDALRDFLQVTIPQKMLEAYFPALSQAGAALGVDEKQMDRILSHIKTLDFKDAQAFIKNYFTQLATFIDITNFAAMSTKDKMEYAFKQLNQTPLERMAEIDTRLELLKPKNFDQLSLQEQVQWGEKLLPMIQERYQLELQYLASIKQAAEDIGASIEKQVFNYEMEDLSPQEQMDRLLEKNRELKDKIRMSTDPAEIARLVSEYQANIDRMVQLGGNRPEDRANAIAALKDLDVIAQERLQKLADLAEEQAKKFYAQIEDILDALQTGINAIIVPVPGPGTGPGGNNPADPDNDGIPGWTQQIGDFADEVSVASASVSDFATAVAAASDTVRGPVGATGAAKTSGGGTVVNVTVAGTAERMIDEISANVVNTAVTETVALIDRRSKRSRRL